MPNNLKRILVATPLYPPDTGGPATYSKLLHEELPQYGYIVTVVSFGQVKHLPYIIRHIAYFFRCLKLAQGVEIVYAQDPLGVGFPAMLAAKLRGVKFMLKIVGDRAWETGQQRFGLKESLDIFSKKFFVNPILIPLKIIQKFVANSAEKVIVPSKYLKEIVSNWGVNQGRIEVIYNSFEPVLVTQTKQVLRQDLNLKGRVIISAGRLVKWKGFDVLIEVIDKLKDKYSNLVLVIAGDGPQMDELENLVKEKDLEDHVRLTGRLEQPLLAKYIKASDLFVLNTGYEGLSHQLLEVMSLGTPIVTTKVGGNSELIENGRNGILVDYNDLNSLNDSIVNLFENKGLAQKLSEVSEKKVTKFTKEIMLKELVKRFL